MGFYCGVLRNGIVQGRQVLAEFSSWRDFFFFVCIQYICIFRNAVDVYVPVYISDDTCIFYRKCCRISEAGIKK